MTVVRSYRTPRGGWVKMAMRPNLVDEPVISSTSMHDEYGVAAFDLQPGELMVDVGAYIGSVGLAVAADYPLARVVMVEAIPENCAVIRESIAANGWGGRVVVYNAAATWEAGFSTIHFGAGEDATDFQRSNQFIGNLRSLDATSAAKVPNMSLSTIIGTHGDIAILKIDCEGCEYDFLADPQVWRVAGIIGEYHHGTDGIDDLLRDTHVVEFQPENASVGIFRAVRR